MKKFLAFAGILFLSSRLNAFDIPLDKDGALAQWIQDVGVDVYYSTGSFAPYLATGGTTTFLSGIEGGMGSRGGTLAVYGILTSTPQGTTFAGARDSKGYVLLRATDTANSSSELLIPPIEIGAFISTNPGAIDVSTAYPRNVFVSFNPPILAQDNLSVSASSNTNGVATMNVFSFAVFYRYLSTGNPENTWIPIDDSQGAKTHDHGLYGVKPSTDSTAGGGSNDSRGTEAWDFNTGEKVMNVNSTDTANITGAAAAMFYYGFSASSGAAPSFFTCRSTGSTLGTTANNLFPAIYPRTLNRNYFDPTESTHFNFPWPVKVPNGMECQSNSAADRYRHYTRNRRALR